MKMTLLSTSLIALAAVSTGGCMAEANRDDDTVETAYEDARLHGRIESMYLLNPHLSAFAIDTEVENGVVHLSGTVESDVDRDLAVALAENLEGVVEVESALEIDPEVRRNATADDEAHAGRRDFGSWVDDATTTAAVKSRLLGNVNTKGLQIDVDTQGDVVTLSGSVRTDEERDLAEQIARGSSDVRDVRNNLVVDPA